jgi:hypothetical protein
MITTSSKFNKEKNVMQGLSLTTEQSNEIVSAIGANAAYVMIHYIAISNQNSPNMEDEQIAKLTGLSEQIVKRNRLELTKLGWFLRIKDKYKGEMKITYIVGKKNVADRHVKYI